MSTSSADLFTNNNGVQWYADSGIAQYTGDLKLRDFRLTDDILHVFYADKYAPPGTPTDTVMGDVEAMEEGGLQPTTAANTQLQEASLGDSNWNVQPGLEGNTSMGEKSDLSDALDASLDLLGGLSACLSI